MTPDGPSTAPHSPVDCAPGPSDAALPRARLRLRGGLIALPCLAVLVVAAWLTPHPGGHGTHRQMGE